MLKLKFDTVWVEVTRVGFGVDQFSLFDAAYPAPFGVFWCITVQGDGSLRRTEIYDTWVHEQVRRQGVARRILQTVKDNCDVVTTVGVKSEMGKAWVEAMGFKYDTSLAAWVLRCPRAKPPVITAPKKKGRRRG